MESHRSLGELGDILSHDQLTAPHISAKQTRRHRHYIHCKRIDGRLQEAPISSRAFAAEQATHKLKVKINGEEVYLYAMKNIPIRLSGIFKGPGQADGSAIVNANLAEADGSRDNLPPEADAPEQFGLGIKREEPKHY